MGLGQLTSTVFLKVLIYDFVSTNRKATQVNR